MDSQNVDADSETGILQAVPTSSTAYQTGSNVQIPDVYMADLIKYDDSGTEKWDLVYIDKNGNDIIVIEDFYNVTESNRTFNDLVTAPTGTVSTIKTFNNAAQIGLGNAETEIPYTVYRLLKDRKFFNDAETASAGVFAHYGRCDNQDIFLTVSDATNASPIVITTTANHEMLGGELVKVELVTDNTAANGVFTITVLTDTTFSLDGSTGNGNYVSGGTVETPYITISPAVTLNTAAGYFQANILYAWGLSLVYNGLQESNLITTRSGTLITAVDANNASSFANVTLTMDNAGTKFSNALYDKRITAVKIYRAESSDVNPENLGLYRLVQTIDINKGQGSVNWASSGNDYTFAYVDNGGYPEGGATYEAETGISETLGRTYVHYQLNAVGGGFHAMAKGYVPQPSTGGVPTPTDWDRYIFFSKRYRPNMMDWSNDFVTIPLIPVALAYYQERFYAFAENVIYRINPATKAVEDEFPGVGCSGLRAVTTTELGIFFCNNNGAYWFDGRIIRTVSDIIRRSSAGGVKWSTFDNSVFKHHIVLYEAYKKYILFIGNVSERTRVWALYVPSLNQRIPRWDYWDLGSITVDANSGAFGGKDGEVFLSNATETVALFFGGDDPDGGLTRGSSVEDFKWTSKEFNMDEPGQDKKFYKVIYDKTGGGTLTVKYANEGTTPSSGVGTSINSGTYITSGDQKKKSIQLYFSSSGVVEVDSAEIVFRHLRGRR